MGPDLSCQIMIVAPSPAASSSWKMISSASCVLRVLPQAQRPLGSRSCSLATGARSSLRCPSPRTGADTIQALCRLITHPPDSRCINWETTHRVCCVPVTVFVQALRFVSGQGQQSPRVDPPAAGPPYGRRARGAGLLSRTHGLRHLRRSGAERHRRFRGAPALFRGTPGPQQGETHSQEHGETEDRHDSMRRHARARRRECFRAAATARSGCGIRTAGSRSHCWTRLRLRSRVARRRLPAGRGQRRAGRAGTGRNRPLCRRLPWRGEASPPPPWRVRGGLLSRVCSHFPPWLTSQKTCD